VFDNSHIQGERRRRHDHGRPRGVRENQYRKFNIKSADLAPGDDYAMMREVLERRFKRLVLDEAEAPGRCQTLDGRRHSCTKRHGGSSQGVRPGG
jgi:excinuclease ABC subunit C